MKPLMFAFERSADMSDMSFRLLILLGESPDPSGKTGVCETTVERLIERCGSPWTRGKIIVACDELRDLGAPVGLVGNYVMWRPDNA